MILEAMRVNYFLTCFMQGEAQLSIVARVDLFPHTACAGNPPFVALKTRVKPLFDATGVTHLDSPLRTIARTNEVLYNV